VSGFLYTFRQHFGSTDGPMRADLHIVSTEHFSAQAMEEIKDVVAALEQWAGRWMPEDTTENPT